MIDHWSNFNQAASMDDLVFYAGQAFDAGYLDDLDEIDAADRRKLLRMLAAAKETYKSQRMALTSAEQDFVDFSEALEGPSEEVPPVKSPEVGSPAVAHDPASKERAPKRRPTKPKQGGVSADEANAFLASLPKD